MTELGIQMKEYRSVGLNQTFRLTVAAASVAVMVAAASMLGGCATGNPPPAAVDPATVIGQPSAYTTLKTPPADKVLVCFCRPSSFVGMAVPWFFIESEKILCTLPNGTYYHLLTTPGPHTFSCKPGPGARLVPMTVDLKAGQIYCFLGGLSGRMALQTPEQANALHTKLTFRKQKGN